MGRIGIGGRLNKTSRNGIIFTDDYRSVKLDPRELIPSEHNSYSQDDIEELADNMLLVGQLQEVIVGRVNGKNRIIVGHRRTKAAKLNIERGHDAFKSIDCKVKEMSEEMFMLTLHSANIFNRRLTDWELTNGVAEFKKYAEKAKENGEITIEGKMRDYIANAVGVSSGKVGQIDSINNNLCEEGKEAFKAGEMNFTKAYETSRLTPEKQQEVVKKKEMLSSEVKEMVEQEKRQKAESKASPSDITEESFGQQDEQLPGQMETYDYPEICPEQEKEVSDSDTEERKGEKILHTGEMDESITRTEAEKLLRTTNTMAKNLLLSKREMAVVMRVYDGAFRRAGITPEE